MEEMKDIINFDVTYAHFVFDQRRNVSLFKRTCKSA